MIVGIIIGPNSLDVINNLNIFLNTGLPSSQIYDVLDLMGLIGMIFLMTLAGMEISLDNIANEKKGITYLSIFTFLIPAAAGFYVFVTFRPDDLIGQLLYASLFASHSVGVVFSISHELNITKSRFGTIILTSTVITDIASLLLLAVCVQMKRHKIASVIPDSISIFDKINPNSLGNIFFFILFFYTVIVYFLLTIWLIPLISKWIFKKIKPDEDIKPTVFIMIVLFVIFIGELIGVSAIVGAFIAGLALSRCRWLSDKESVLQKKIEGIGYGFLTPILFLTIGMKTDIKVLFSAWQNLTIVAATVIGLVASKLFSGWLSLRILKFNNTTSFLAGLLTIPQLTATLAAAAVGIELGMIDQIFFNAIVCLSIFTTIPVPIIVKYILTSKRNKLEGIGIIPGNIEEKIELDDAI